MDMEQNTVEDQEITVVSLPLAGVQTCTVDTKEIEANPVVSVSASELNFEADFADEHVAVELESLGKRKHVDESEDNPAHKHVHIELQNTDTYEMESFVAMANDRQIVTKQGAVTPQEYTATDLGQQGQLATLSHAISTVGSVAQEPTIVPAVTCNASIQAADDTDDVNQAWFTTKEDKDSLHVKVLRRSSGRLFYKKGAAYVNNLPPSVGHIISEGASNTILLFDCVKWRQGMWSKEENELLRFNILNYCKMNNIADPHIIIFEMSKDDRKDFYRTIAKGIKRPLFAIYRRVLRMYDRHNYIGKYSSEEVEQLRILKEKHGNDWATIGAAMGRSASSVKDRFRLMRDHCQSGKWSAEEEERLSSAVRDLSNTNPGETVTGGLSWASVAQRVGTRSEKQCRSKWLNYLNWKEQGGQEWTKQDEIQLIKRIYNSTVEDENDINWAVLATDWPRYSVRSPQWLRSKWWALKKHIPDDSMGFQETLEYLYSTYIDTLQTKLERQEARFRGNRLCPSPINSLPGSPRSMHIPVPVTTGVNSAGIAQTITVSSDGTITAQDDGELSSENRYEVVQVNSLASQDAFQAPNGQHAQQSYIIQSVPHQSAQVAGHTYTIIHQPSGQFVRQTTSAELAQEPQTLDGTPVHSEQVQISTANVVTVLQSHHAVQTLPEVNPELSQAIVQTDISGPITPSPAETHHLNQGDMRTSSLSPGDMAPQEEESGGIIGAEVPQQEAVYESDHEGIVEGLCTNSSVLPTVSIVSQTMTGHSSTATGLQPVDTHELNTINAVSPCTLLATGHTDTSHSSVSSVSDTSHAIQSSTIGAMGVSSIADIEPPLPAVTFCLSNTVGQLTSTTIHGANHEADLSSSAAMSHVVLPEQILQQVDETCELSSASSANGSLSLPCSVSVNLMSGDDPHLGAEANEHQTMGSVSVVPIENVVVMATCETETQLLSSSPTFTVVSQSQ